MAHAQRRVYAPVDGYEGGYRGEDAPPPFVRERSRRPAPVREEVDMGRTKYPTFLIALIVLATVAYVVWTFTGGAPDDADAPVIQAQASDFKSAYEGGADEAPPTAEIDRALAGEAAPVRAPAKTRAAPEQPIAAPAPAPMPAPTGGAAPVFAADGPFAAQIASLRSAEAADAAWTRFSRRSPALFQNARKDVQAADLGERGVYFRVRAGYFASRADAAQFCGQVKALGQECLVVGK
ncbi:MAG: SPOR domain-containing protein [Hyphomonadaceae bacterium]|nr:SPOR domain-containing protein [Hyphomonadaceae bacterium]